MTTSGKFIQEEKRFSGAYSRGVLNAVYMSYRPYIGWVIGMICVGILGRLLLLFSANVMGYWADSFCHAGSCKRPPAWFADFQTHDYVLFLVVLAMVGFVLNSAFRVGISRVGTYAVSRLYDEVTLRTSRFPMSFFDATPIGRMTTRFGSDYGAIFRMAGGPMGEFLCLAFDLVLMIVLTGVASPYYIPLVLLSVFVSGCVYKFNLPGMRRERRALSRARGPAIAHFSETVQGARVIKVFGRETVFLSRFLALVDATCVQRMRTLLVIHGFSVQMTASTSLLLVMTGVAGIFLLAKGEVSVGSLAVAFTFVMMSANTVQSFFEWLASLEEALTGFERLDEYLRSPLEEAACLPAEASFSTGHAIVDSVQESRLLQNPVLTAPAAEVEVSGACMRYRQDLPWVLDDVSFVVNKGENLGIIGRTGSGKSSLIQALFCLYPLERGWVKVGRCSPFAASAEEGKIPLDAYRSLLSLIPQEPVLFRGTLRENLVVNVEGCCDDALIAVLRTVGLADFVASLGARPLDSLVLERGANLSMGQRQLICLARCLLKDAPVVVMDEATSAVDPVSESFLLRATQEFLAQKTRIVVAHRLTTIASCDRVLWLDAGRIKMIGAPQDVIPVFRETSLFSV